MKTYIQNFKRFKPLLIELVSRDIKVKYRRSVLGVFWTLLNPLLMMAVLSFVFSNLFRFEIDNFPIYILSAQVIFNFFTEATNSSMTSIIGNSSLIKKVYIPKYLFPFARVCSSFINIMASFTALIIVMIVTRTELHLTILFSVVPIAMVVVMAFGIGLILASIAVKFRDTIYLYGVFLTALNYLVPMIYPMSILDEKPLIKTIVTYNPLTTIITMFRDVIMYNNLPTLSNLLYSSTVCIIFLLIGVGVFYKSQDTFILNI